jgi:hypothetical protein
MAIWHVLQITFVNSDQTVTISGSDCRDGYLFILLQIPYTMVQKNVEVVRKKKETSISLFTVVSSSIIHCRSQLLRQVTRHSRKTLSQGNVTSITHFAQLIMSAASSDITTPETKQFNLIVIMRLIFRWKYNIQNKALQPVVELKRSYGSPCITTKDTKSELHVTHEYIKLYTYRHSTSKIAANS